ncbi:MULTISPECIES: hypothetical protein [unclassified Solwaraspora]|uniref:hypothetical protein n=1 Tax=unclassified Solwaraspora TaxID=2627926 RepID=UPI00259B9B09|nr:hypothetical protein [Solwaraspora sp. WMMA2056]WJK38255.1 hypothetical protein O7608_17195 [Solwaraspora sp. WMMA2056]
MDRLPHPADGVPSVDDTTTPVSPGPLARLLPLLGHLHLVVPGPPADWDGALSAGADGTDPAPAGERPTPGTRIGSAAGGGPAGDQQSVAAPE